MIDIILVNSPIHDYSNYPKFETSYSTPIGLIYLATTLKINGYNVEIIDSELRQLNPFEIANIINSKKPKFVGLNAFTVNYLIVEKITNFIEQNIRIIIGGPHVTGMNFNHFKNHFKNVEIFIQNDGEYKLLDILNESLLEEIPSIYYRRENQLFESKTKKFEYNLDDLPIPDRSFLDSEPYMKGDKLYMDISISRGCIFDCSFCAGSCSNNGSTYKKRSIELIKKEILFLKDNYRFEGFKIVDDLPFCNSKELEYFLDFLESEKLNFEWEVNFPFRLLKKFKPKQFKRLYKNGIKRISVGIESGSDEIRELMGKKIDEIELFRVMSELFKNSISVKGYFVLGFPNETKSQMESTINLAKKIFEQSLSIDKYLFKPRIFMYKMIPKTRLWTEFIKNGYNEDTLLKYVDFEVQVTYYNKHAWGSLHKFSEVEPKDIIEIINSFYTYIESNLVKYGTTVR